MLSLPLHTLQYVQSFPPSILCTVHYNPYTPLYISFSFLGGFLATSENTLACSWPHTLHFYKQNRNYFSINLSYLSATHINEQFHGTVLSKYNRHALIVIHNNYTYTLSSTFSVRTSTGLHTHHIAMVFLCLVNTPYVSFKYDKFYLHVWTQFSYYYEYDVWFFLRTQLCPTTYFNSFHISPHQTHRYICVFAT